LVPTFVFEKVGGNHRSNKEKNGEKKKEAKAIFLDKYSKITKKEEKERRGWLQKFDSTAF
jgi:hypothetical protein